MGFWYRTYIYIGFISTLKTLDRRTDRRSELYSEVCLSIFHSTIFVGPRRPSSCEYSYDESSDYEMFIISVQGTVVLYRDSNIQRNNQSIL